MSLHGIVLAAGEGKRLRPITLSLPKPLIPLLGKPMITYGMEQLHRVGISEAAIVVGWLGWLFKEKLGNACCGMRLSYVTQSKRLGIAHAIALAIENSNINRSILVYLGDNLMDDSWTKRFKELEFEEYDAIVFLAKVPDPRRFGVAIIKNGKIVGFVEKPEVPPSPYALVGLYYFRDPQEYMKCFRTLRPSARGEYEITDIINCYIAGNKKVGFINIEKWWKDAGKPRDLIEAMMMLMDMYVRGQTILGEVTGEVVGNVIVEEGAVVEGRVYGPAYIGKGVKIGKESTIEHYCDLEERARIASGSLTRTLVLDEATLDLSSSRMTDSIIGPKSRISIDSHMKVTLTLVAAQESELELR